MATDNRYCVIMAGGAGTRFWPLSRNEKPKQFLDVSDTGKSFIRQTYERFRNIVPEENILIVTSDKYKDLLLQQVPQLDERNILLEPYSRNTAPCIAYATYTLLKRNPLARVVVTPSDHMIADEEAFRKSILDAFEYIARTEGIICAIESAHAIAQVRKIAKNYSPEDSIIVCVSGRGDKDCAAIARYSGEDIHE